ncbi:MAG: hypothetical protein FNP40_04445 [Dehalobacter sp. 4CP]|nr:hypothetical protein [Dehalobacter sp. 4CP]
MGLASQISFFGQSHSIAFSKEHLKKLDKKNSELALQAHHQNVHSDHGSQLYPSIFYTFCLVTQPVFVWFSAAQSVFDLKHSSLKGHRLTTGLHDADSVCSTATDALYFDEAEFFWDFVT